MHGRVCALIVLLIPAWPSFGAALAITNVRIIDGNGGPPIEQGVIVINDRLIEAVGPRSDVRIPAGAKRIDGGGKTALPGLADMHVHLLGGTNGVGLDILGYQKYLNALLYAGVTTVMDTGNVPPFILQLRGEVRAGRVLGPRIYCVGPLVDGADPVWPALSVAVGSRDQVPRIVATLADEKVDFVKLYVGLSDQLIRAISTEAKKHKLRTIIDQWHRNGSADVAEEGIAGFAHFPSHRISDETIATIKAHNVFLISTLAVQESALGRRFRDLSFLEDPLIADTTSKSALDSLRREYGNLSAPTRARSRIVWTCRVRRVMSLACATPECCSRPGPMPSIPAISKAKVCIASSSSWSSPGCHPSRRLLQPPRMLRRSSTPPPSGVRSSPGSWPM
jgi:hypothetical protein